MHQGLNLGWSFDEERGQMIKKHSRSMPRSDDAGWIIHCQLFIQRMWLAFLLNTLLASFDFLFHYSLLGTAQKLQPLPFCKSLFRVWEKEHLGNSLQLVLMWSSKHLPGKGQPGTQGIVLELGKQCSYAIQLQMNSVTLGKSLCSLCLWLHIYKVDTVFLSTRYCKAGYVKDDKLPR